MQLRETDSLLLKIGEREGKTLENELYTTVPFQVPKCRKADNLSSPLFNRTTGTGSLSPKRRVFLGTDSPELRITPPHLPSRISGKLCFSSETRGNTTVQLASLTRSSVTCLSPVLPYTSFWGWRRKRRNMP